MSRGGSSDLPDADCAAMTAEELALYLEQNLPVAFSEKYGFLTAYPSNTGTGLRASVMVHLPVIAASGKIANVFDSLEKAGYTVPNRESFDLSKEADYNMAVQKMKELQNVKK